jgi:hypothetical protein
MWDKAHEYEFVTIKLVGGWPTPKNMRKSVGIMTFPTEWKNKIHVPNHQPVNHRYISHSCSAPEGYRTGTPSCGVEKDLENLRFPLEKSVQVLAFPHLNVCRRVLSGTMGISRKWWYRDNSACLLKPLVVSYIVSWKIPRCSSLIFPN